MELQDVIAKFGVNPDEIGNRPRGWWILSKIEDEEAQGNAEVGFLCVKTRDGGSNAISMEALQKPNCVGTAEDGFDCTYRYYYYRPLTTEEAA